MDVDETPDFATRVDDEGVEANATAADLIENFCLSFSFIALSIFVLCVMDLKPCDESSADVLSEMLVVVVGSSSFNRI